MANKVGPLIKEARTSAGFTQDALAKKIKTITAGDISKAERGELELSQAVLKEIAKATGVTQKSLLEAAAASTYKKTGTSAKKPSASSTSAKTGSTSSSKAKSSGTTMTVSATEKKMVELYRIADSETRKKVLKLLKGEELNSDDILTAILNTAADLFKLK